MANNSVQIPTLPSIGTSVDPEVRRSFDILKSFFAAVRANGGFGNQTIQQTIIQQTGTGSSSQDPSIINPPYPPGLSSFAAASGFASIILTWTDPGYSKYGYIELWRSTTNQLGNALFIGTATSPLFVDIPPSASITATYYYWAKVVSYTGLTGPWTDMVSATTATDPPYVLESLTNQITTSQLATTLNTRINLIDTPTTGLIDKTNANAGAIITEANSRAAADTALSTSISSLSSTVGANTAAIATESSTRVSADSALTSSLSTLNTTVGNNYAALQTEQTVRAAAIAPNYDQTHTYALGKTACYKGAIYRCTTAITSPEAWNAAHWTAVPADLYSQYVLKLDVNGYVSGLGMANDGTSAAMGILADKFWIMYPNAPAYSSASTYHAGARVTYSGQQWKAIQEITTPEAWNAAHWTNSALTPFLVDSQYGVVIDTALIKQGTIQSAQIQSLGADKISAGTLNSGLIWTGQLDADLITTGSLNANLMTTGTLNAGIIGAGTINADRITANTITTDRIISDAVTVKNVLFCDGWDCAGGETGIDIVTTPAIPINTDDALLVIATGIPSANGGFTLSRSYGAVNTVIGSSSGGVAFDYSLMDHVGDNSYQCMLDVASTEYPPVACGTVVNIKGAGDASEGAGQWFRVPSGGYTIGQVLFKFGKYGSPTDSLLIQIVDAAAPTVVIASGTLPASAIPSGNTKKTNIRVTLSVQGPLPSSTATYQCRVTRTGAHDSSNFFRIWGYGASVAGSTAQLICNNGVWNQATSTDTRFQAWAYTAEGSWVYTLTALPDPSIGSFASTDSPSGQVSILQVLR